MDMEGQIQARYDAFDDAVRAGMCVTCLGCGEIEHSHPNAPHADYVTRCEACDGRGWSEVETELITQNDLAALDARARADGT